MPTVRYHVRRNLPTAVMVLVEGDGRTHVVLRETATVAEIAADLAPITEVLSGDCDPGVSRAS